MKIKKFWLNKLKLFHGIFWACWCFWKNTAVYIHVFEVANGCNFEYSTFLKCSSSDPINIKLKDFRTRYLIRYVFRSQVKSFFSILRCILLIRENPPSQIHLSHILPVIILFASLIFSYSCYNSTCVYILHPCIAVNVRPCQRPWQIVQKPGYLIEKISL